MCSQAAAVRSQGATDLGLDEAAGGEPIVQAGIASGAAGSFRSIAFCLSFGIGGLKLIIFDFKTPIQLFIELILFQAAISVSLEISHLHFIWKKMLF